MSKRMVVVHLAMILLFPLVAKAQSSESLTMTTYYPSPFGVYSELRGKRMAVGNTYYNQASYCWNGTCTNGIPSEADLIVEDRVGIGTYDPQYELDVNGDIRAANQVCINTDCRSSWPITIGATPPAAPACATGLGLPYPASVQPVPVDVNVNGGTIVVYYNVCKPIGNIRYDSYYNGSAFSPSCQEVADTGCP